ncbi:TonB-dependent receptor [Panacibacter sp. DH6]|uniref:TonB-dependent receptor n=1 Tax=Panacibacter microcysteis TaxID=2793269 RepID=A0A931GVB1_9BACT|nr:outer membrane beta-barrel protein [Panacibacter microcysteis]MBG9377621.1 TonB-dependent receptor [Panacibacter microcysteis]
MKRNLLLLFTVVFFSTVSYAQTSSVKGIIRDTSSRENLANTTVALLRGKDSILVKFTRTNTNGAFELKGIDTGKYVLLITYPKYADYVENLTIKDSAAAMDLGTIPVILKANLLQEVIVRQTISAIRVKGDTTEYNADSFRVQPNASVEDLLKKLPGIQVDRNGQITAQGEKVQKVLVDGEEFFGDDPTLVTQNLRADMIDKVQVFDKKSDQANFTGIDDGERQKTLNLKLKDNKKNGYFGKINAGAGTDGYHDNQAMINSFKNKQKIALYGIVSNTGTSGLNWQDQSNFGDNPLGNADYDETGGYFFIEGGGDDLDSWDGRYNGQGYPLVQTGGVHYNNKWNDDKNNLNLNYKIMQLHVTGNSATEAQSILPDSTSFYNNSTQNFANEILRNRGNGSYEYTFDTTSSIRITADGGIDHKTTRSTDYSEALGNDKSPINNSQRNTSTIGDNRTVNSNILWKKKLKKKGRTVSFNLREKFSNNTSDGYLYADNRFFNNGAETNEITDQYKAYNSKNISFDSKITYSEPLSKVSSIVVNYGVVINNSNSERSSYNKSNEGKYTIVDSIFSNDYAFNVFTHRAGANYSLFRKKLKFNAGTNVGITSFDQKDMISKTTVRRSFVNWFPQANFSYNFSQQRRVFLRYNGSTEQPSIQQIQPVATNDDPLNIAIGNPDLKPAFRSNINLGFFDFKVLTERNIWTNVGYTFTQNAIGSRDFVDPSTGKRVYQSVNVDGNRSIYAYMDYGIKLKKLETRIGLNANVNGSRYVSIVNDSLNTTNSGSYTLGLNINKDKEKKYSFYVSPSATYTTSKSSIQTGLPTKYWTFNINTSFDVFLPLKFQIHSDCDFNFRQKTEVFSTNNNVILWNAWVGKKFMKKENLLVKVTGHDLLNQNIGFDRTVNSNYISQRTYSTIQRFFLLSLVWNFTKAGTTAPGMQ